MHDGFVHAGEAVRASVETSIRIVRWRQIAEHLEAAIDLADDAGMRDRLGQALAGALELLSAQAPAFAYAETVREEAREWCDAAAAHEIESYVAAGLRRVERSDFMPAARKRLLVALWESLPSEDRRKFLSRVDPDGEFVRRAG